MKIARTHPIWGMLMMLLAQVSCAFSHEPVLTIVNEGKSDYYPRSTLTQYKHIEQVQISNNRAYPGRSMHLTSIKLCDLLRRYPVEATDMLEFVAADQFSVFIPAIKIQSCDNNSSIAYLAIEPPKKWPLLSNGTGATAGPFDVIWIHPEKSYISNEYWAWSVVKIVIHKQLDRDTLRAKPLTKDRRVLRGFDIYISHCAGCHTMNGAGKGVIGPDLNNPKNPVEYYPNDALLKKFIRDPQSVRVIKNDRMSGSGEDFLNNEDLENLIRYFHFMAKKK